MHVKGDLQEEAAVKITHTSQVRTESTNIVCMNRISTFQRKKWELLVTLGYRYLDISNAFFVEFV
jgi:hypothetical protein